MADGRRWLITGVSSGIGAALASAVLARGERVIGIARDPAAIARFEALAPGRAEGLQLDVSRTERVEAAVHRALEGGVLDVVVNNAGQSLFGALEETSIAEVRALFDINVFGPWALAQAVLPHMRARGQGTLVHVSSGCGLNGMAGMSAYCASKFALEGFSESLAQELQPFGINVMLVEPGAVATRFISHGTRETARRLEAYGFLSGGGKAVLEAYYAESAATPEAVADAVLTALNAAPPPLRLLIGADMREPARRKGEALVELAGL
jgi:NAD(P)-dependent dehydrogenase (short-subunit alcohol dehydrogenase family)